jgi:hypothetical protein
MFWHSVVREEQALGQEYTQVIVNDRVMCLVAHKTV